MRIDIHGPKQGERVSIGDRTIPEYGVAPEAPGGDILVSANATFSMTEDPETPGMYAFEITAPAHAAGIRTVTDAQLASGPVAIIAPHTSNMPVLDEALTTVGAYGVSSVGAVSRTHQMRRNGVNIGAPDPLNYLVTSVDVGSTLQVVAILSDANGSREMPGPAIAISADIKKRDTFTAPDGTDMIGYVGDSGEAWSRADGGASKHAAIWDNRVHIEGSGGLAHYIRGRADRGIRQRAECDVGINVDMPYSCPTPLVRGTATNGIYAVMPSGTPVQGENKIVSIVQKIGNVRTTILTFPAPDDWGYVPEARHRMMLDVDGADLTVFLDGVQVGTATTALTSGGGCGFNTGDGSTKSTTGFLDNFACEGSN